ncbi:metallophosphoesterase family protein [Hyalangium rubrum]|uniref:Metallophosphoesterase family protein n=1 Tax=Hyalangium rubrum TaxID=3103134 RepID=A0ABU5H9S3_9BACT|nr:metallophosphoesterase family protein [Hyalangium sp. s54d21]MDY7229867.1 metallophosphoesterase family protein [Hyalangium sp. s54d21]
MNERRDLAYRSAAFFGAWLALAAGSASAATLSRGPYLQSVTSTSALVAFRLDTACSAQVRYGAGGDLSLTVTAGLTGRQHAVQLAGLQPGTEYSYAIEGCGASVGPLRRFRTATEPQAREVRFAVLGDFGTGGSAQRAVVRTLQTARPELIVTVGDNIYESGTDAEFESNFLRPMAALLAEVPIFPSMGNHEYVTNQGQPYLNNLYLPANNPRGTERYYSFDWGNVHFVALDSNCLRGSASADRCIASEQLAWLKQDLAASRAQWKVVYLHHPLWSTGEYGSYMPLRQQLAPVLESGGVDLVFAGHEHDYERTRPMLGDAEAPLESAAGITYVVVGSGGANLRPFTRAQPSWSVTRDAENNGFLEVSVQAERLSARMVTPSGKVVDSFALSKPVPPEVPLELTVAAEPSRGVAPLEVLLGAAANPSDAQVSWRLSDGRVLSGAQVRERFEQPGTHEVEVEARRGSQVVTRRLAVVVDAAGEVGEGPSNPAEGKPGTPPPSPEASVPGAEHPAPALPEEPLSGGGTGGCNTTGSSVMLGALSGLLAALLGFCSRRRR